MEFARRFRLESRRVQCKECLLQHSTRYSEFSTFEMRHLRTKILVTTRSKFFTSVNSALTHHGNLQRVRIKRMGKGISRTSCPSSLNTTICHPIAGVFGAGFSEGSELGSNVGSVADGPLRLSTY